MHQRQAVVVIHSGDSPWLPFVLDQARSVHGSTPVVLIGDASSVSWIRHYRFTDCHSNDIEEFSHHYVHMSSNARQFELLCWQRWFYLRNFMRSQNLESVMYLDSDVLVYSPVDAAWHTYFEAGPECGLSVPKQRTEEMRWMASGHCSLWTPDILEDACQFMTDSFRKPTYLDMYRDKWQWHVDGKRHGGVCDMTTLYLFWLENAHRIVNLSQPRNRSVFDHNIQLGSNHDQNEYLMESGMKKISFVGGRPYLHRMQDGGGLDLAHCLHFQGSAKQHLHRFCRDSQGQAP